MIQVRQLTKYYGEHAAIKDLDFDIQKGEVVGFLGLNGAGKTTTLKVLACLLLPTSGRVVVENVDVTQNPHEVRKKIGFLPDTPPVYGEMTVASYLAFAARLRRVSGRDAAARVVEAEEKTGLREVHGELIGNLSHGYRQRVGLAQALVHKPTLLILDEPTSGLDPVQIVEMRGLIRRLRGEHTLLISSHQLAEISQTCDRLLVIQKGEIVAQGTEAELAERIGAGTAEIEVEIRGSAARAVELGRGVVGVTDVSVDRDQAGVATLRVRARTDVRPELARALVLGGVDLLRMDRGASRLESIFIQIARTGGPADGGGPAPAAGDGGDGRPS
jgi:ABC-2 type transport system ATP-binding protein